jgi:hypothetical protein
MSDRPTTIRETMLLTGAVVFGVLTSLLMPLVGLPLAAAGTGGLAYRGQIRAAAGALAIGAVLVGIISRVDLIFVLPAVAVVLIGVALLPRFDSQLVGALMLAVLAVASYVHQAVVFALAHLTPTEWYTQAFQLFATGSTVTVTAKQQLRDLVDLAVSAMPAMSFYSGMVVAVAIMYGVAWAAKRSDREVSVPALGELDLTPHVMWPFIIGLLALAASYGPVPQAMSLRVVGLNLLLCARALFALQGFGVSAGLLGRANVGLGGRIFALAALAALDVVAPVVTIAGLLDFWVNFRRLPRDGATPESPEEAMSDS